MFFHKALQLPFLFYLGRYNFKGWVIQDPQRGVVMPHFPAYISVMFASFDSHSMLFVDNHLWVSISVLLVNYPCELEQVNSTLPTSVSHL